MKEMIYRDILNIREETTTKVDRLMKEAMGWDTEIMTFNKTKITKVSWEDGEVMILQLNYERRGPVWRQTQGPDRRRTSI